MMVAMVATSVDLILEILDGLYASVLLRSSISMPHPGSAGLYVLEHSFHSDDELGNGIVGVLAIYDGEVDVANGGSDVRLGGHAGGEASIRHGVEGCCGGGMLRFMLTSRHRCPRWAMHDLLENKLDNYGSGDDSNIICRKSVI